MQVHFSSVRLDWATPPEVFDPLNEEFRFTLDPCCFPDTAKCPRYFTPEVDGLSQPWAPERVFMNPPYGREIGPWMQKAAAERERGALVVCLVPARTDTAWWHNYVIATGAEVRFVRGRIRFIKAGQQARENAPFPCAVIVMRPNE